MSTYSRINHPFRIASLRITHQRVDRHKICEFGKSEKEFDRAKEQTPKPRKKCRQNSHSVGISDSEAILLGPALV